MGLIFASPPTYTLLTQLGASIAGFEARNFGEALGRHPAVGRRLSVCLARRSAGFILKRECSPAARISLRPPINFKKTPSLLLQADGWLVECRGSSSSHTRSLYRVLAQSSSSLVLSRLPKVTKSSQDASIAGLFARFWKTTIQARGVLRA